MIYVASSWRNLIYPDVIDAFRRAGISFYDFRNPEPGNTGFKWTEIDEQWRFWSMAAYIRALDHPVAVEGFELDYNALNKCNGCALINPCGKSAHLELGYVLGQGKPGAILLDSGEPELMYKMAPYLCTTIDELVTVVKSWG